VRKAGRKREREAVCEYLWNSHAAAIASDTFGVEVFPADRSPEAHPFGFLHHMLIGQFGMALGELWWLSDLARRVSAGGAGAAGRRPDRPRRATR
jgi:hypothetical protein